MAIESSLRTYLLTKSGITNLVSTRIYPLARPQNSALPAIVYQRITGGHEHMIAGAAGNANPVIQIDCLAASYSAAKSVAEQVRQALQGYSGAMGSDTVHACVFRNEIDLFEPPDDGSDVGVYRTVLDYAIRYVETIPS